MCTAHSLAIKADLDNLGLVRDFIESSLEGAGLSQDGASEFLLAVDEAVSNIIMHGFKSEPNGDIELDVKHQPEAILVQIRDNAPLFDPTKGSNPHLLEVSPLERDAPGGFGVYLFKHLVDKIAYRVTEDGRNELSMQKNRRG